MSGTSKAVLLVADISGFTKFMQMHAVSTSHAKQIVVRLLKSLMKASKPPLKVAELDGFQLLLHLARIEISRSVWAAENQGRIQQLALLTTLLFIPSPGQVVS